MKNGISNFGYTYRKYGKFWSVSPGHFIKHKPLISEDWVYNQLMVLIITNFFHCVKYRFLISKLPTVFTDVVEKYKITTLGHCITRVWLWKNKNCVLVVHSSEVRGLRQMKFSSETLQNLLYFMYNIDQGIHKGKSKVAWNENEKKTTWVFLYIKYSKFWSASLEHFVERKHFISEECGFDDLIFDCLTLYMASFFMMRNNLENWN